MYWAMETIMVEAAADGDASPGEPWRRCVRLRRRGATPHRERQRTDMSNVAVVLGERLARYGFGDAHHGDGVFYAFEEDPAVVFADLHEDGRYLYPGTGARQESGRGAAEGTKLNLPLPPGADDEVFAQVWPQVVAHLEKFSPEFIILQCGADSIEGDPITHLRFPPRA